MVSPISALRGVAVTVSWDRSVGGRGGGRGKGHTRTPRVATVFTVDEYVVTRLT